MAEIMGQDRPLPAERAFVVQLHVEADVAQQHMVGRVVHVVSGQTAHFDTLAALLTFIDRVLRNLRTDPPAVFFDEP
jgi:hypothetical protein